MRFASYQCAMEWLLLFILVVAISAAVVIAKVFYTTSSKQYHTLHIGVRHWMVATNLNKIYQPDTNLDGISKHP
jgi:hypothetical protein